MCHRLTIVFEGTHYAVTRMEKVSMALVALAMTAALVALSYVTVTFVMTHHGDDSTDDDDSDKHYFDHRRASIPAFATFLAIDCAMAVAMVALFNGRLFQIVNDKHRADALEDSDLELDYSADADFDEPTSISLSSSPMAIGSGVGLRRRRRRKSMADIRLSQRQLKLLRIATQQSVLIVA